MLISKVQIILQIQDLLGLSNNALYILYQGKNALPCMVHLPLTLCIDKGSSSAYMGLFVRKTDFVSRNTGADQPVHLHSLVSAMLFTF